MKGNRHGRHFYWFIFAVTACLILMSAVAGFEIANASLTDGLVAYYPFNGNANDESGNGNNGTVNGATLTADKFGNANKAYNFDGVDDYISISAVPVGTSISASVWAKSNTSTWNSGGFLASFRGSNGFIIHPSGDTSWQGFVFDGSGTYYDIGTHDAVNISTFHNYSITYDSATGVAQMFFDGQVVATKTLSLSRNSSIINLYVGRDSEPWSSRYGNAIIDDLRIYNRALSASEIQALYTEQQTPSQQTVLYDDFNDGVLNKSGYTFTGNNVSEHDGMLDFQNAQTDAGGSGILGFGTSLSNVKLEVRWYIHYANNYSNPGLALLHGTGVGQWLVGAGPNHHDYPDNYNNNPLYHNVVNVSTWSSTDQMYWDTTGVQSSDMVDRWITTTLILNSDTGRVQLDFDGDGIFEKDAIYSHLIGRPADSVFFNPSGWWTGHYINVDWLRVTNLATNPITTYNALNDFSTTSPVGTWSYGEGTTGSTFMPLNTILTGWTNAKGWSSSQNWVDSGLPAVWKRIDAGIPAEGDAGTLPNNLLYLCPAGNSTRSDVIIKWIAPSAGVYNIEYTFARATNSYPYTDGINALVFLNSNQVFTSHLDQGGQITSSKSLNLLAGDTLYFGIND